VRVTTWGFGGGAPSPLETNGELKDGAPTLRQFFQLLSKNKAFLSIFWSKFLLKNVLLNDCNCVDKPSRLERTKTIFYAL